MLLNIFGTWILSETEFSRSLVIKLGKYLNGVDYFVIHAECVVYLKWGFRDLVASKIKSKVTLQVPDKAMDATYCQPRSQGALIFIIVHFKW